MKQVNKLLPIYYLALNHVFTLHTLVELENTRFKTHFNVLKFLKMLFIPFKRQTMIQWLYFIMCMVFVVVNMPMISFNLIIVYETCGSSHIGFCLVFQFQTKSQEIIMQFDDTNRNFTNNLESINRSPTLTNQLVQSFIQILLQIVHRCKISSL